MLTRTDTLMSQAETGKMHCVHRPCWGRLPPGVCDVITACRAFGSMRDAGLNQRNGIGGRTIGSPSSVRVAACGAGGGADSIDTGGEAGCGNGAEAAAGAAG